MTDRTPDFNVCLKERGIQPLLRKSYNIEKINSFLQEAHEINARITELTRELRAIRPRYLSTALPQRRRQGANTDHQDRNRPLSNQERDEFDAQSKLLMRQLSRAVLGLKQAEDVRNQTADSVALSKRTRGGLGGLTRWAAGGAVTAKSPEEESEEAARKTITEVRENVVVFLQKRLERAAKEQTEMIDVRLSRELEKSKSALAKSSIPGGVPYLQDNETNGTRAATGSAYGKQISDTPTGDMSDISAPAELTQEQQQAFAEENHELLKQYENQLDQVRTAERSILEISELHSTLHANLQQQTEHIDQLVQDHYLTSENVGKGNKELKRASERRSTAQALFYSTIAFCSFLVVWDLIF